MKYKIFKQSGHVIELQRLSENIDATHVSMVECEAQWQINQLADAGDWQRIKQIGSEMASWVNSKGEQFFVTCDD